MITTDFELVGSPSPLLVFSPTTPRHSEIAGNALVPGDEDEDGDSQDDWTDFDDDNFEDWAGDEEEFHQSEEDNNTFDPEDDDHLPEDEDF